MKYRDYMGLSWGQYDELLTINGGVPQVGVPNNGWFTRENLINMDDEQGCPYFRKPPYGDLW